MEHNLGLTCDPIGGLVQIPASNATPSPPSRPSPPPAWPCARRRHFVSLDKVIKTMRETGRDMKDKYKETARGASPSTSSNAEASPLTTPNVSPVHKGVGANRRPAQWKTGRPVASVNDVRS